jgi:hypothetical protein
MVGEMVSPWRQSKVRSPEFDAGRTVTSEE